MRRSHLSQAAVCALTCAVMTAGCTSADPQPPTDTATPSPSASASTDSVFAGPVPKSAIAWWKAHPDFQPANVDPADVLLDQSGDGPGSWRLDGFQRFSSVVIVIICTTPVAYDVELLKDGGGTSASTQGNSCGGPNINVYETPAIDRNAHGYDIKVGVPAGTKYAVTVVGKS